MRICNSGWENYFSMNWPLSNHQKACRLERGFQRKGIPFDAPGFYDHLNFVKQEQRDPRFLELYARYVEAKAYDFDYLAATEQKVAIAANVLESAVRADGRLVPALMFPGCWAGYLTVLVCGTTSPKLL